jgi:ATP-binding cassette subfamily F protein 3
VAERLQKQESQPTDAPKDNANSAQARKDQKRREAELRTQTQPLRKEITRLEKEMEKLNAQLAQAEEKLGDSGLYDQSRKAELTECLQQQAKAKAGWKSAKWPGWRRTSSWSHAANRLITQAG